MFTQNQIEQAKNLESKTLHNILGQVLHKSEYELKLEEAEKNWPFNFTIQEFYDSTSMVGNNILKEIFIGNLEVKLDETTEQMNERASTNIMHRKFPITREKTYKEMYKFVSNYINNQKPPVIQYVEETLIPDLNKRKL
jgi:hypothetical protein